MTSRTLAVALEVTAWVILFLPLAFMLGLFSQIKTFLNWFLEQIEFHVFGGSGSAGLRNKPKFIRSVNHTFLKQYKMSRER